MILRSSIPTSIRPIFFAARLVALKKKDGDIRPIAALSVDWRQKSFATNCVISLAISSLTSSVSAYRMAQKSAYMAQDLGHIENDVYLLDHILTCKDVFNLDADSD